MNPLRLFASLMLFLVAAMMALTSPVQAFLLLLVGSPMLLPWQTTANLCTNTLTPIILLQQTMRALFVKCPALMFFANEFTTERLKLNQQVIGKIRTRPVTSTYDANAGGYKNGAQESRDLLLDVPFTMDQHIHVTVKLSHLYALSDSIIKLQEHFDDSASVIGKGVSRYMLGKVDSKSFTNGSTYTTGNSNKDALNAIRKSMNLRGVPDNRFALVNSDVMEALSGDSRITNRYDNASQSTDGQALGRLSNLAGFRDIVEDPELSTANGDTLTVSGIATTDIVTTTTAHGLAVNDRVMFLTLAGGNSELAINTAYYVVTVGSTTTFKVSATRGGSAIDVGTAFTGGTVAKRENITGFFATREAIAIKTGLPTDSIEAAQAFGIPVPVSSDVVTDPDSGLSMIAYKWFEAGTMDAYITLAVLYGATAGALADTTKKVMEPCGHILRSA